MANYEILNEGDEVINVIIADENFVAANYNNYRLRVEPEATEGKLAQEARQWRDGELTASDWISQTPDHPERVAYLAYRVALRDWPEQDEDGDYINGFPDTKPEL